jgi:hypothetical protein
VPLNNNAVARGDEHLQSTWAKVVPRDALRGSGATGVTVAARRSIREQSARRANISALGTNESSTRIFAGVTRHRHDQHRARGSACDTCSVPSDRHIIMVATNR